ncbi:DUF423 domain-containing protein [Lutimonas vermicola]|uniref:DUF423 domain-containing protein n=1 Tax=Lutimonas vermicola TaxID=414288 RepID=A0ABU9KX20_9FLAO
MMMILIVKLFGAVFGFFGVIFGAFGAHRLKRILPPEVLHSFETGVKYQLIHAVVLLFLGFHFDFIDFTERMIASCMIIGVLLFSFSIYGLCYAKAKRLNLKFLGPITPVGGLLLMSGWGLLIYYIIVG